MNKEQMIVRFFDDDFCLAAAIEARDMTQPRYGVAKELPNKIPGFRRELLTIDAERDIFAQHGTDATVNVSFSYPDSTDDTRSEVGDTETFHFILVPSIGNDVMKFAARMERQVWKSDAQLREYVKLSQRERPAFKDDSRYCILVGEYTGKVLTWEQADTIIRHTIKHTRLTVAMLSDVEAQCRYNKDRFGSDVPCYAEFVRDHDDAGQVDREPVSATLARA